MRRKDDILWKVVMEEVFDDLLRFVYADADEVYDLERGFEFLEKELAEIDPESAEAADTRFADKLVKVYYRNGVEEWVFDYADRELEESDNPFALVVLAAKTALLAGRVPE